MRQRGRFGSIGTSIYTLVFKTVEVMVDLHVKIPIVFLPEKFISSSAIRELDTQSIILGGAVVFERASLSGLLLILTYTVVLKRHAAEQQLFPVECNPLQTLCSRLHIG